MVVAILLVSIGIITIVTNRISVRKKIIANSEFDNKIKL